MKLLYVFIYMVVFKCTKIVCAEQSNRITALFLNSIQVYFVVFEIPSLQQNITNIK